MCLVLCRKDVVSRSDAQLGARAGSPKGAPSAGGMGSWKKPCGKGWGGMPAGPAWQHCRGCSSSLLPMCNGLPYSCLTPGLKNNSPSFPLKGSPSTQAVP